MMSAHTTPGFSYTITRTLQAPADAVWAAWTNAEQYAEWAWAKEGSVEIDARTGGAWKSTVVTPEGEFPLTGSYLEVVDGERLVMGMDIPGRAEPEVMTLTLDRHEGGGTGVTVSQTCDTAEARDQAEEGTNMLLDSLTEFLAKRV
ncbi:SRPBCC domain-containing protein [Streptomyces monticola]|uniref:SRPBCC domain-containing protein n=1 Tax=Streptomyces monticola TaxID=2666263 RepID=A0ABW2JFY2_9ACTN